MTPHRPDADLLADLDAGVLDAARAREVRAAAEGDAAAAAVLDALAATRAELGALPALTAPPEVVARWSAGAAGNAGGDPAGHTAGVGTGVDTGADTGVVDPDDAECLFTVSEPAPPLARTRHRRMRPTLAAAAVLAAVVAGSALAGRASVAPPAEDGRVAAVDLAAAGAAAVGTTDVGELADPARRSGCLRAAGIPDAPLLGGRRVVLEDRPGILLVLPAGAAGSVRLVVVAPGCGPEGAGVLADTTVGR